MKNTSITLALLAALLLQSKFVPCYARREYEPSYGYLLEKSKRGLRFQYIWEQRFNRDVSASLLPFLDDPDEELAQRAVRALGRLEKPGVLPELEKRSVSQTEQILAEKADHTPHLPRLIRYLELDTAIARINSRNLHGKEKIEFVLASMPTPWNWAQAVEWSKKINTPGSRLTDSQQSRQIREVVDLLYTLSKQGENVEPLRRQFTFSKAQNVQLDGANLPLAQEAEHLLDYSQTIDIVGSDEEYVSESHLLSVGEPARVALRQRMQLLLQTKPQFKNRNPFICILRAAAMTGDQTFAPLIQRFSKEMSYVQYTSTFAENAESRLTSKTIYSYAPQ